MKAREWGSVVDDPTTRSRVRERPRALARTRQRRQSVRVSEGSGARTVRVHTSTLRARVIVWDILTGPR